MANSGRRWQAGFDEATGVSVRYISLLCSGSLSVPTVTCRACSARFTPTAIEAGCFTSSPTDAHAWYELGVLSSYAFLGVNEGLSVTGFVEYLEDLTGEHVDDRQFVSAYFAYLRAADGIDSFTSLGVEGMDEGLFADCPICATTPTPPASEGVPAAEHVEAGSDVLYRPAVSCDAVTKLGHYSSCGLASSHHKPQISRYFGPVDARVESAHAAGRLNLRSALKETESDPWDSDPCACQSSLHCARPDASSASGPCDIHGVCGAVCMHTIPLHGLFCDMRTPEQFAYYLFMLDHLVQQRPDVQDVYIDFGCRIRSTWERYVAAHPQLPAEAKLRIMVNWMHGSGHDVACQLTNCGRYMEGAGRGIGEQIEQLWSMTKVGGVG
ncbi:hypothetical protein TSOC_001461, partial [Tetrabaena socialis]